MIDLRHRISIVLLALYAAVFGSWLFYATTKTFWSKALVMPFPSFLWLTIVLAFTILVFATAYRISKAVVKKLRLPSWIYTVASPALATPCLNLLIGLMFARLNGVDNVYGFPLARPWDLFADQVFLFLAGVLLGLGILFVSFFASWTAGKVLVQNRLP